jgi:hypothetical protein
MSIDNEPEYLHDSGLLRVVICFALGEPTVRHFTTWRFGEQPRPAKSPIAPENSTPLALSLERRRVALPLLLPFRLS